MYNISYNNLINMLKEHFKGIDITFNLEHNTRIVSRIIDTTWSTAKLHYYIIFENCIFVFDDFEYSENYNKVIKICKTFEELVTFIKQDYDSWWNGWEEFDKKTSIENS